LRFGFVYLDHIAKRYVKNNIFSEKQVAPKKGGYKGTTKNNGEVYKERETAPAT